MAPETLDGGFAEPVFGAQAAFRVLMQAMSRPGTIVHIAHEIVPPLPLQAAAAAIAYTLADQDTRIWLDAELSAHAAVRAWLAFHTGAPLAASASDAAFALVADTAAMPALSDFCQGTQDYPDRSTTVIAQVEALQGGKALTFAGPGIQHTVRVAPLGLPADFTAQWDENRNRFPRGVDLILVKDDAFVCLPRSSRLVRAEG